MVMASPSSSMRKMLWDERAKKTSPWPLTRMRLPPSLVRAFLIMPPRLLAPW